MYGVVIDDVKFDCFFCWIGFLFGGIFIVGMNIMNGYVICEKRLFCIIFWIG